MMDKTVAECIAGCSDLQLSSMGERGLGEGAVACEPRVLKEQIHQKTQAVKQDLSG